MKSLLSLFFALTVLIFSACQQGTKPDQAGGAASDTTAQPASAAAPATTPEPAPAPEPELHQPQGKPKGAIYRADGARPGMASEWVQVDYDKKVNKINGIWYWNVKNEKPIQVKVLKQEFSSDPEGMISGYDGELSFYKGHKAGFGIIEQTFILEDDGMRVEFEAEGL